jgi:hypothetical protein
MVSGPVSVPNGNSLPEKPSATQVQEFHTYADTDSTKDAIHHTLGAGQNQAASGQHKHNGSDSPRLWEGKTITGSRSSGAAVASIIALLVEQGATDSSTA